MKNFTRILLVSSVCFGAFIVTPDALAQSTREVNNRLIRMEKEIETLSRAIYKGEVPPAPVGYGDASSAGANAQIQIQQLQQELQRLTGLIEEQNYKIRTLTDKVEKFEADAQIRFEDLEKSSPGSSMSSAGQPQVGMRYTANVNNGAAPAPGSAKAIAEPHVQRLGSMGTPMADAPDLLYDNSFAHLKEGRYELAEEGFLQFLKLNSGHKLAPNAKYWLGETYYVRGEYEQAAKTFAEAYQNYPNSDKAADNLFKLGKSLTGMGKTGDACVALGQLVKDYAGSGNPTLPRAQSELKSLGCQS